MAKGWVTTARGELLNLDQLITDSKRPLDAPSDEKTEIKKRVIKKRKPLNVRGYRPVKGKATVPDMPKEMKANMEKRKVPKVQRKVAFKEGGVAEAYSDLTGVKLKRTEGAIKRKKERMAKEEGKVPEVENSELSEILEELEESDEVAKPTGRRRVQKKDA